MTDMTTPQLVGRDYLRVSYDPNGGLRSPQQQHADNARAAAELGVHLNGESYAEADAVSASQYGGKIRGAFGRLLADLRAGTFGADVLVLWESSRGSRQTREWLDLIDACAGAGVRILVTADERLYVPANATDRRNLLAAAIDAEYESSKTSKRINRAANAAAEAGEVWGPAPYGYRQHTVTVWSEQHGRNVKRAVRTVDPGEADVVREVFARIRAGHTLGDIADGLTARTGRTFTRTGLRSMALRPAYAGLRVHHKITRQGGRKVKTDHTGDLAGAVRGQWDAIVDDETFYAVRQILTGRMRPGRGNGSHLLGMIARCGKCGSVMTGDAARSSYRCRDHGCVKVNDAALDEYAERVMLAYLAQPGIIARLSDTDEPALAAARAELAIARAELAQLRAAAAAGKVTVGTLLAVEPGIVSRVESAEQRERELVTPSALSGLIDPGDDAAARWDAAPMSARRQVSRILLSPAVLGELTVLPARRRGEPAEDRVEFRHDTPGR